MVYDLSHYDLDELRELKSEVERKIKELDSELAKMLDDSDNGTLEESLDEVRYEL